MNIKRLKIAVLGSTKGTNLDAILNAIKTGELDAEITMVISDKKDAYILQRAKNNKVAAFFIDPKSVNSREDYDKTIVEKLKLGQVELVLLIGYMRIISPYFVKQFKNKIMNIHPSLLPAFAGGMDLDVHKLVIESGVKITGCTLHFVDDGTDTGPIILQKAVEITKGETPQTLKEKVQKAEQEIILKGIKLFKNGQLKVQNDKVQIVSE